MTNKPNYPVQGFTLLEVIVAIAIFAMISLASFSIFDTVLKSESVSKERMARINELQRGMMIIERDFIQLSRRHIRLNGGSSLNGFIHTTGESFSNNNQAIGFVRSGWSNPGLLIPRSDLQSVAYQLNDSTLERLHFNFVDPTLGEEPKVRPLITGVKEISFEYSYGKQWQKRLRGQLIPQAVAVILDTEDFGIIRRQILLAGDVSRQLNGEAF